MNAARFRHSHPHGLCMSTNSCAGVFLRPLRNRQPKTAAETMEVFSTGSEVDRGEASKAHEIANVFPLCSAGMKSEKSQPT